MKNILAIIAFVILTASTALATNDKASAPVTTTSLSGQVIDKSTGEALAGVKIIIDENVTEVYTDLDGNFTIADITTGNHEIKADLISYESQEKRIEVTLTSNSVKVEIEVANN